MKVFFNKDFSIDIYYDSVVTSVDVGKLLVKCVASTTKRFKPFLAAS
jgi:hypothetical protein